MPSFLQVENISKSYGPKVLFENISFNINEGDKIALVAPNGTGKTTLLRILAGTDKSDSGGSIKFLKDIRIAFMQQEYAFQPENTIQQQLFDGDYERELRIKRILTELGLSEQRKMSELSGGEIKRVAIADMLSREADFLIMDEPTNHLDVEGIEYLEKYLKRSRCTLFMVTHDRYFLDRVCNTVMEMDYGAIYVYRGNYGEFLEKREERIANYNAQTDKVRNILRRELEWMRATPCARSGKAKYRKQAFWDLKDRAEQSHSYARVSMDELSSNTRLGSKIIDCKDLNYDWEGIPMVSHFTYNFQRYERVGIVGTNGVGKSTFLNLLAYSDLPSIERGASIKIGYYRQEGMSFNEEDTVLDVVPDTRLLGKFLFPHDMFANKIAKLSGGERRRLYLLTVLMQEPNVLILDEPTNDLDIVTLNVLEEYLLEFKGTLIIVTHDRHFLDRLVDHLLVFCGDGKIKDFVGGYSEYRCFIEDLRAEQRQKEKELARKSAKNTPVGAHSSEAGTGNTPEVKKKLTYKERLELEALERTLDDLNAEKSEIEQRLSSGTAGYDEIAQLSARYAQIKEELELAELRWLELSC
ncbi:MAG: ABC-F family ATP-binding cassette domain-containing protein [Bacteroidales bacterium]|nr:ABC-F family ATP-binding cassette domain-containing protein [Bacteroidales bacterium]